eukprot:IDg7723t1
MGDVRRNTAFFEYQVQITFDGTYPMEVMRFLRKFGTHATALTSRDGSVCHTPIFLKDSALRSLESANRVGSSASFGVDDWPSAVNWLLREEEDDMAYFNPFEEVHARCGACLPDDQLVSAYIESVDGRIRPIFREAREDSRRITLLELCRKADNHGETLQRNEKTSKDLTKGRGILRRTANLLEQTPAAHVHLTYQLAAATREDEGSVPSRNAQSFAGAVTRRDTWPPIACSTTKPEGGKSFATRSCSPSRRWGSFHPVHISASSSWSQQKTRSLADLSNLSLTRVGSQAQTVTPNFTRVTGVGTPKTPNQVGVPTIFRNIQHLFSTRYALTRLYAHGSTCLCKNRRSKFLRTAPPCNHFAVQRLCTCHKTGGSRLSPSTGSIPVFEAPGPTASRNLRFPLDPRTPSPSAEICVKGANGSSLGIEGQVSLDFRVGTAVIKVPLVCDSLPVDVFLGTEFIDRHIRDIHVEDRSIDPKDGTERGGSIIIELRQTLSDQQLVSALNGIVQVRSESFFRLLVANFGDQPIWLHKGQVITHALAHPAFIAETEVTLAEVLSIQVKSAEPAQSKPPIGAEQDTSILTRNVTFKSVSDIPLDGVDKK